MINLIKLKDIQETHWKNGKGKTKQIAIFPKEASVTNNDFLWRLSSAEVSSSGPFSLFPDNDRLLIVWQGDGLLLNNKKLLPDSPLHFLGEEEINCDLINGPVVDLGLIYNSDKIKASMEVLSIEKEMILKLESNLEFFFVAKGEECLINNIKVETGDTIKAENESELVISPSSPSLFYRILIKVL